jgi:2,3-bisphosphoglycerate-independent phosphoglycerate mutase
MLHKAILLILDGLGDRPIPELGHLTPLEKATAPNLDRLAREGICGLMSVLGPGFVPGSDVAHLTIFGYDIHNYYAGRGPIEAVGLGLQLAGGDVALRGNLSTVDDDLTILDRRAGGITDVSGLVRDLDGLEIDGVRFIVRPGTAHRAAVIMRGQGLSAAITDPDSHFDSPKACDPEPTDHSPEAKFTAEVVSKFIARSHEILARSPINTDRKARGLLPANFMLLRGAGKHNNLPSFEEKYGLKACGIAGAGLYKGLATYAGMTLIDVPGATGLEDTDVRAKFTAALRCLETFDFVFVHVKATDSLSHDGNYEGKAAFIEKIDAAAEILLNRPDGVLLVVTGDHTTSCTRRNHTADPVPILMHAPHGDSLRVDQVTAFGERPCQQGGLGKILGIDVMPEVMTLLNRSRMIGT